MYALMPSIHEWHWIKSISLNKNVFNTHGYLFHPVVEYIVFQSCDSSNTCLCHVTCHGVHHEGPMNSFGDHLNLFTFHGQRFQVITGSSTSAGFLMHSRNHYKSQYSGSKKSIQDYQAKRECSLRLRENFRGVFLLANKIVTLYKKALSLTNKLFSLYIIAIMKTFTQLYESVCLMNAIRSFKCSLKRNCKHSQCSGYPTPAAIHSATRAYHPNLQTRSAASNFSSTSLRTIFRI